MEAEQAVTLDAEQETVTHKVMNMKRLEINDCTCEANKFDQHVDTVAQPRQQPSDTAELAVLVQKVSDHAASVDSAIRGTEHNSNEEPEVSDNPVQLTVVKRTGNGNNDEDDENIFDKFGLTFLKMVKGAKAHKLFVT